MNTDKRLCKGPRGIDFPREDTIWHHRISGKQYRVKCVSNLSANKKGWFPTVVYEDTSDVTWSRPIKDFLDRMI